MAVITLRRGTSSEWSSVNPTLSSGEEGLETDTGRTKIGNGTTPWKTLNYADAYALDRLHQTGSQGVETINGLLEYIQDQIGKIVEGDNVVVNYDDTGSGLTTISFSGESLDTSQVQNVVSSMLVNGAGINLVKSVNGDKLTISSTSVGTNIKTYPTEAAAQAGLLANEFADGDLIVVGP